MKTLVSTGKSRNGRINQARQYVRALATLLDSFAGTPAKEPYDDGPFWASARELVEKATKAIHEANAYNNVMVGDGIADDDPLYVTRQKNGADIEAP